jgi:mannose-6-phosphate isomerase-like protein (cupin superfamily)
MDAVTKKAAPHASALRDGSPIDWEGDGLMDVTRLISRGSAGSELQTGVVRMRPGAHHSFTQAEGHFENHYVVRGRVKVSWSRSGDEQGEVELGPDEAFHFAPGCHYVIEPVGDDELFIVNSMTPPTV